jgi:hypothetical protein
MLELQPWTIGDISKGVVLDKMGYDGASHLQP